MNRKMIFATKLASMVLTLMLFVRWPAYCVLDTVLAEFWENIVGPTVV